MVNYVSTETSAYDNLIAGPSDVIKEECAVALGQGVLAAGAVLGLVTATAKYALCAKGASDGSETAVGILAEDINATSVEVTSMMITAGEVNENALSFGADTDADDVRNDLRAQGIILRNTEDID